MNTRLDPRVTQQALLSVLEKAGVGVVVLRVEHAAIERLYINRAGAALCGYTPDDIKSVAVLDTIAPSYRATTLEVLALFEQTQQIPAILETVLAHRDGSEVPIEISVELVRQGSERVYFVLMRTRGTQAIASLPLLEADRIALVGALAAGVAHEINNPLTSIKLNLGSLRKNVFSYAPEVLRMNCVRMFDDIAVGVERISNNVRALMGLARPGSSRSIDVAAITLSALRLVGPTLDDRALVTRRIEAVATIPGEEVRVGQAIVSMLMFSASGFSADSPTPGAIVVSVSTVDNVIEIRISDNGTTPTHADLLHAFDPFYQSPNRGAGVGIGLSVARAVATGLGGQVEMRAAANGGAELSMRLPRG
ncbi:MAG: PAS domain S-box protein [Kofleriaceae bacterium]|nr:PAS domain S-box protein [Kofleriaceae bacterium]